MIIFAAITALLVLTGLSIFQVALIFGAPIGKYAWGGAHTKLPRRLKIASSMSIILYALFAIFILNKTGIIAVITNQDIVNIGMWVITAYFFLGIGMNAISRSKAERNLMTPIALALAVLFLIVSLS